MTEPTTSYDDDDLAMQKRIEKVIERERQKDNQLAELHNATIQVVQVMTEVATALNSINNTLSALSRHVEGIKNAKPNMLLEAPELDTVKGPI